MLLSMPREFISQPIAGARPSPHTLPGRAGLAGKWRRRLAMRGKNRGYWVCVLPVAASVQRQVE